MTSIIKVDQIQTAAGAAPAITDLGVSMRYFKSTISSANYASGGERVYGLSYFAGSTGTGGSDAITITEAGTYKLDFFIGSFTTEDGVNSRWQENYLYLNSTKILDSRANVTDIDNNNEYYAINGTIIVDCAVGDTLQLRGNGVVSWGINASYGSNITGIRIA